ncbi:MAG TPA: glycosyltransferase family 4 protein [Solirubrobacteraceae bacterium]
MRVLFFNEGNLGTYVLGQGQLDEALRHGLENEPELDARFAGIKPLGRLGHAFATRRFAPLSRWDLDYEVLRHHALQSLRARAALRRELDAWTPDVVHVHTHSISFALAGTMRRVPLVVSLDTTVRDWWEMPAWHKGQRHSNLAIAPSRLLERRALKRAALVLAWTAWARRGVEREAPGAHVVEHHPGIDLDRYRPAPRQERRLPRVLFVGGRFAEKGGEDLLQALGPELGQTVELDLVTPIEVEPRAGLSVHRLAPGDPRLVELQQQADVFCLPTYGDAAPWAVLEAMACGTPVLASGVGGIPEMLDRGRAGMLVGHGDVRALRTALHSLIGDPARREALAAAARTRCETRYDHRLQFAALRGLLADAVAETDTQAVTHA